MIILGRLLDSHGHLLNILRKFSVSNILVPEDEDNNIFRTQSRNGKSDTYENLTSLLLLDTESDENIPPTRERKSSIYSEPVLAINDKNIIPLDVSYHEYQCNVPNIPKICIEIIDSYIRNEVVKTFNKNILCKNFYESSSDHLIVEPHIIESITEMNELYISPYGVVSSEGSDSIFEREHIDGPFFMLPYVNVIRCMVGINGNSTIITYFPESNREISVPTSSFMAFDYNRDAHCIRCNITDKPNTSPRILLKLHYVVYPPFVPRTVIYLYKKIHAYYNILSRRLFVNSQISNNQKATNIRRFLFNIVNGGTELYFYIYKKMYYSPQ